MPRAVTLERSKKYTLCIIYQGGDFGKNSRVCRPTADPEQIFRGFAGRTPIRRRFPKVPDFPKIPEFPNTPIFRKSPVFRIPRPADISGTPEIPEFSDFEYFKNSKFCY